MLTVHNKGHTEAITSYSGYELHEEINGALELSFTAKDNRNNPGFALLQEEAIIEDEDGREYRIKQMKSKGKTKAVSAFSTYFDLGGHYLHDIFGGTRSLDVLAHWIFEGTGWTYEIKDITESRLVPNFGEAAFPDLMEILLNTFKCERQIMPNNHVVFERQIGPDNDAQYRFGHNIKALTHNVDTTNLKTWITGYGGNGLKVTYTSPLAEIYGTLNREAEPIRDERFTVTDSMLAELKDKLVDTPLVSIELEALELTKKALGERVWLIYEPLNVEFQTRILSKVTRKPARKSTATIGNTVFKTLTDQLVEQNVIIDEQNNAIEENAKETKSRFEQTNDTITLAVERFDGEIMEAYAQINLTADGIRSEVAALQIEIEEDIESGVSAGVAESKSYIDQTALQIQAGVSTSIEYLDGRVEQAESSVTMLAGQITASITTSNEYTDSKVTIINAALSAIDDEFEEVVENIDAVVDNLGTLESDLATLNGDIVTVREEASSNFDILSGSITASVSTTRTYAETVAGQAQSGAETYTDGQINNVVTTASSNFSILSGRINTKAEASTVTSLGTRVNNVEFDVSAVSGQISSKVSTTDFTGATIASKINQSASNIIIQAEHIQMDGIVRLASSIELGYSGNGQTKAIKFNGTSSWIYNNGDFNLNLDASYTYVLGNLYALSTVFGQRMPVIVGTSANQGLSIGLSANGELAVYRPNGTGVAFAKSRDI